MEITREVIIDLLPVYHSGAASQDTRNLVEAYLLSDPELAQLSIAQPESVLTQTQLYPPREIEMQTLEKTKKILWQRSLYLGFAIFFTCFTFALSFDRQGPRWIWENMPIMAGLCFAIGVFFWARYAHATGKLKGSAL